MVGVVVGPQVAIDEPGFLGGGHALMVFLKRREAVLPEVDGWWFRDHRPDPEVVNPVGVIHGLGQPGEETDPGLDNSRPQPGMAALGQVTDSP